MPIPFRRSSWSCQKASERLDSLPRAGGALLGAVDVSPEDMNGADDSLAAFVKEKLELLWSGKSCMHCWKLQVTLAMLCQVLATAQRWDLSFCHLAAKAGHSLSRTLCCRGL